MRKEKYIPGLPLSLLVRRPLIRKIRLSLEGTQRGLVLAWGWGLGKGGRLDKL